MHLVPWQPQLMKWEDAGIKEARICKRKVIVPWAMSLALHFIFLSGGAGLKGIS